MACRDFYRGSRELAVELGRSQGGYITYRQLTDLFPEEGTDLQFLRWLKVLNAHGIRRTDKEITCAP